MVLSRAKEPRPWRPLIPAEQQPQHHGKPTLVLDLNHTLVTSVMSLKQRHDFTCIIPGSDGGITVNLKRPHVDRFLAEVAKDFEVVAFTSNQKHFADPILDKLDPEGTIFAHRLFLDSCTEGGDGGDFLKDLSMLGRGLERTMVVDDTPEKALLNPDNWIPVSRFDDDPKDRELLGLIPFLKSLTTLEDVRPAIVDLQKKLRVRDLVVPSSSKKQRTF